MTHLGALVDEPAAAVEQSAAREPERLRWEVAVLTDSVIRLGGLVDDRAAGAGAEGAEGLVLAEMRELKWEVAVLTDNLARVLARHARPSLPP